MKSSRSSSVLFLSAALAACAGLALGAETPGRRIIKASGVKAGLCVHLGVTDGKLTAELSAGGRFLVHGLAADRAAVERARKHIRSRGIYGKVSVARSSFEKLPYAENLVNLLVAENGGAGVSLKEVARVLVPDGAACFGGRVDAAKLSAAGFKEVRTSGAWTIATKPRPREMDEWTHRRYSAGGNAVSRDRVDVPSSLRWQAGTTFPPQYIHYYGLGAAVTSGGRILTITNAHFMTDKGPLVQQALVARDAYNGLLLWKRKALTRRPELGRNCRPLVAVGDRVYAVLEKGGPLLALDAATGKIVKIYEQAVDPDDWLHHQGALVVRRTPDRKPSKLICLDAATGAERWSKDIRFKDMVADDGKIFLLTAQEKVPHEVVCLEAAGGREKWRVPVRSWGGAADLTLLFHRDGILVLGAGRSKAQAHAVSAKDGRHLWSYGYPLLGHGGSPTKVFFVDGLIWVNRAGDKTRPTAWEGLDPATGRVKRRIEEAAPGWSRNLCGVNRATRRFIICRTMLFVDVKTGKHHRPWGFKNACGNGGLLPANGLVYSFTHDCVCYPMLRGNVGLSSDGPPAPENGERLLRGPAFGFRGTANGALKDEWPTYRADARRSAGTKSSVPADLKRLWAAELAGPVAGHWASEWGARGGGPITAPTVAGGLVFVARPDTHRVVALDAGTGRREWSYTAGGRVDTPPTVHRGLCLFGANDGWVYCLRAADGKEVWRFRAAPGERKIVAFGQVESAWPVHGSVLVFDGLAYFAAGRHSKVDGGITVYAVQPATGRIAWNKPPGPYEVHSGGRKPKAYHGLNALLVADGGSISFAARHYLWRKGQSWRIDPKTGQSRFTEWAPHLAGRQGLLADAWTREITNSYVRRFSFWNVGKVSANILVFDGKRVFGFISRTKSSKSKPSLFGASLGGGSEKRIWAAELPEPRGRIRIMEATKAMVLAGENLWVAGRMNVNTPREYQLQAYSAAEGRKLSELRLDSPPVFDGMAAANGRLYVSTKGGRLLCLGGK